MFFGRKDPEKGYSLSNPSISKKGEDRIRVGGQAVIEGVMMRSPNSMAIAVRRPSGEIVVKRERLDFFSEKKFFSKLPLIRGVMNLLSALVLGMKALNFSANQSLEEEKDAKTESYGKSKTHGPRVWFFLSFGFRKGLIC